MKARSILFTMCILLLMSASCGTDENGDDGNITSVVKLQPGIYLQDFERPSVGNCVQIGKGAYRLNAGGTYNFGACYDGGSTQWDNGGTWSQSGNKLTLVAYGNPMIPAGSTGTYTIVDGGKAFEASGERWKRIN